jgi:hypothetical protein
LYFSFLDAFLSTSISSTIVSQTIPCLRPSFLHWPLLERVLGNIFLSFLLGMAKKQPPGIWTSKNLRFGQGLCRSFTKEPSKRRLKKNLNKISDYIEY